MSWAVPSEPRQDQKHAVDHRARLVGSALVALALARLSHPNGRTDTNHRAVDEVGSGGLTSIYGKSPVRRQDVRLNGCVARAFRRGAPVDSSEKGDGPRRQRPGSHAVGQSNTDPLAGIGRTREEGLAGRLAAYWGVISRPQVRPTTTAGCAARPGHPLRTGGINTSWSRSSRRSSRAALSEPVVTAGPTSTSA
jgi:hypothetical protein